MAKKLNFPIKISFFAVLRLLNLIVYKSTPPLLPLFFIYILTPNLFRDFSLIYTSVIVFSSFFGDALNSVLSKFFNFRSNIFSLYIYLTLLTFIVVFVMALGAYFFLKPAIVLSQGDIFFKILILCLTNIGIPSASNLLFINESSKFFLLFSFFFYVFIFSLFFILNKVFGILINPYLVTTFLLVYLQISLFFHLGKLKRINKNVTLKEGVKAFLSLLPAYFFGGPIHGLCLILFSKYSADGYKDMALFTIYYPVAMIVNYLPSAYSTVLIQKISYFRGKISFKIRNIILSLLLFSLLLSLCIYMLNPIINNYIEHRISQHSDLLIYALIVGLLMSIYSVSSAILIAQSRTQELTKAAICYSIIYLLATFFVILKNLGITGFFEALILSLIALIIYHLHLIKNATDL